MKMAVSHAIGRRSLACLAALMLVGCMADRGWAQEDPVAEPAAKPAAEPAVKPAAEPAAKPAAKQRAKPRGRLPNFYRTVVTEEQREAIYEIQADSATEIKALQAQIDALVADRDAKVQALLSPEQLQKIKQAEAESKAKRDAKKAAKDAAPAAVE